MDTNELFLNGDPYEFQQFTENVYQENQNARLTEVFVTKVTGAVPYRESAIITAAAVCAITKCPDAAKAVASAMGGLISLNDKVYYRYDQYKSKERFWSNYTSQWYNKYKNKNISLHKNSSSGKRFYGPKHGSWFDPVRP
ncbi:hypothetical protein [Paeniclostridium hominis]|uniref:hypothetical protein n=1 Tax=Paeniclostridium hominis TaxID=2764329 RepID=UPI0022E13EF1|nr:hypothetical protein [Paeniclostridium hominis]